MYAYLNIIHLFLSSYMALYTSTSTPRYFSQLPVVISSPFIHEKNGGISASRENHLLDLHNHHVLSKRLQTVLNLVFSNLCYSIQTSTLVPAPTSSGLWSEDWQQEESKSHVIRRYLLFGHLPHLVATVCTTHSSRVTDT